MYRIYWLPLLAAALLSFPSAAVAQQSLHWELSIENAKRVASQSNKLVLIEFSAPWCGQCRVMENEVFSQPGVAGAIEANYVPVRINVDYAAETAKQYRITGLPTTVIIAPTPQGEVMDSIQGRLDSVPYLTRLNRVAVEVRRRAVPVAQITATDANPASRVTTPQAAPAGPQYAALSPVDRSPLQPAANAAPVGSAQSVAPPVAIASAAPPAVTLPAAATSKPLLGLDGYCPVQLTEKSTWTRGDRRWGAIHQGRTYLFAGPEQQRRFFADPDRYAPVNMGNDVVLTIERGQSVLGHRQHGVYYAGHVYLFADEATLKKFAKKPDYYAQQLLQATARSSSLASQKVR